VDAKGGAQFARSARETVTKGTGGVHHETGTNLEPLTALAVERLRHVEAVGAPKVRPDFDIGERDRPGSHSVEHVFQHQARIVGLAIDILLRALQARVAQPGR